MTVVSTPRRTRSGRQDPRKPGLFVVGFAIVLGIILFCAAMSVITHSS